MKTKTGFTLIELLIFIIVMGIIGGLLAASYLTILRGSKVIANQNNASQIASRCMDWYTGERFINGFNSTNLNCGATTPNFCAAPQGYSITTNINCSTLYGEPDKYKTITVEVTGSTPATESGKATLSTIIADY